MSLERLRIVTNRMDEGAVSTEAACSSPPPGVLGILLRQSGAQQPRSGAVPWVWRCFVGVVHTPIDLLGRGPVSSATRRAPASTFPNTDTKVDNGGVYFALVDGEMRELWVLKPDLASYYKMEGSGPTLALQVPKISSSRFFSCLRVFASVVGCGPSPVISGFLVGKA